MTAHTIRFKRWRLMTGATERLTAARTLNDILETLRSSARAILRSDGVTVVRREGDKVLHVGEDAIAPLWSGQRFPIRTSISGMAMIRRETIIIPDVRRDSRVPHDADLSTFVASMAMAPIGVGNPVAAIGSYWRSAQPIEDDALVLLDMLAKAASAQLERIADHSQQASPRPRAPRRPAE